MEVSLGREMHTALPQRAGKVRQYRVSRYLHYSAEAPHTAPGPAVLPFHPGREAGPRGTYRSPAGKRTSCLRVYGLHALMSMLKSYQDRVKFRLNIIPRPGDLNAEYFLMINMVQIFTVI